MLSRLGLTKGNNPELKFDGIFPITNGDSNVRKILILFNDKFKYSWRYTYENIKTGNVFSYNISGEQVGYLMINPLSSLTGRSIYVKPVYRNIGIENVLRKFIP